VPGAEGGRRDLDPGQGRRDGAAQSLHCHPAPVPDRFPFRGEGHRHGQRRASGLSGGAAGDRHGHSARDPQGNCHRPDRGRPAEHAGTDPPGPGQRSRGGLLQPQRTLGYREAASVVKLFICEKRIVFHGGIA